MGDSVKRGKQAAANKSASPSTSRKIARAELIWDGKYDAQGKRVAPLRVALPFQTVETVNESAQDRQKGFQFGAGFRDEAWRNRLIWGDKKYVLPSLLPEFAGKVNLIYIDPPFDTGTDFSFTATVPDNPESDEDDSFTFTKEPSIIEHKAYRDTWGRGLDSYLQWFYETAVLLHELLHEEGSLYVHLDSNVVHYAKVILDEVFGAERHLNDIVWKRTSARSDAVFWGPIHDTILFYTKSENYTWNDVFQAYDDKYLESKYNYSDERGRYFPDNLTAAGLRGGHSGKSWRGLDPAELGGHWKVNREAVESLVGKEQAARLTTQEKLELLDKNGYIYWPSKARSGGQPRPRFKKYLGSGVAIQDIITDIPPVNSQAQERVDYRTQKPEALLKRIIDASTDENDLLLDCYCGSGTTSVVAEKNDRRWIACDLGRFAIHSTRKRLLSVPDVRPFVVQNLGKYERQVWAGAEFGDEQAAERQCAYIDFILKLAQATPLNGYTWLHGVKGGRMIHIGAVDAPVSVGDVTQIAAEFKRAVGTGKDAPKTNSVDVLGWDFAFEINEVAKQQAAAANIQMRFLRIPRDVMDKRAVEQGDIHFFELAALSVDVKTKKRNVFLKLKDFVIPPDDVPEDARKAVKHWSQWIDYWAVDWDNRSDTFHNEWQTYRTRKDKSLQLEITHTYADPGDYTIVVKVIDILGNDTTKTVKVKVE
jgi:DNA modification methylase